MFDLGQLLIAFAFGYEKRELARSHGFASLLKQGFPSVDPSVFLELRTSIEQVQSAVEVMNALSVRAALAHPVHIFRLRVLVAAKAIVGSKADGIVETHVLVH